jgi:hypothetical protein
MQPTIAALDQYEKMDSLLKGILREPDARILFVEFHRCAPELDLVELQVIREMLIEDGALVLEDGKKGLEIRITEAGIDFFLSGGYTRDWSEWMDFFSGGSNHPKRKSRTLILCAVLIVLSAGLFYWFGKHRIF